MDIVNPNHGEYFSVDVSGHKGTVIILYVLMGMNSDHRDGRVKRK